MEEGKKRDKYVLRFRPQQMLIRGGGPDLDSYRPNQPSDKAWQRVERLFIVCFGVRETAQVFATGCLPGP